MPGSFLGSCHQLTESQIYQAFCSILVFLPIPVGLVSRQHPPHPLLLCSACSVQHILSLQDALMLFCHLVSQCANLSGMEPQPG